MTVHSTAQAHRCCVHHSGNLIVSEGIQPDDQSELSPSCWGVCNKDGSPLAVPQYRAAADHRGCAGQLEIRERAGAAKDDWRTDPRTVNLALTLTLMCLHSNPLDDVVFRPDE